MFSALMLVRMREAVYNTEGGLTERESWLSDDSVDALDLPLAKAAEKVLASMHEVLTKTAEGMKGRVQRAKGFVDEQLQREKAKTDGVNGYANGHESIEDGHVDKKLKLDSTQPTTNGNIDGGEDRERMEKEEGIKQEEEEEQQRRKQVEEAEKEEEVQARKRLHLMKSKAAELRLVRHLDSLRHPKVEFRARRIECS